jgi:hypothetical protein
VDQDALSGLETRQLEERVLGGEKRHRKCCRLLHRPALWNREHEAFRNADVRAEQRVLVEGRGEDDHLIARSIGRRVFSNRDDPTGALRSKGGRPVAVHPRITTHCLQDVDEVEAGGGHLHFDLAPPRTSAGVSP